MILDEFVAANRAEIITRCRTKASTRNDQAPPRSENDQGIPMFLDQLLVELRDGPSVDAAITGTAMQHGRDLLKQGYSISEVVHDYGDVCQSITELAVERQALIEADHFRTLNRCLDDAIAGAVTEFAGERDRTDELDGAKTAERSAVLTRDLVKALQIAKVAYAAIRSGKVGVSGSTGGVLSMGLDTALGLAERLLTAR